MLFYVTVVGAALSYKLQDKIKYGLIKTSLISSASYFNLRRLKLFLFGGISPQKNVTTRLNFGPRVTA